MITLTRAASAPLPAEQDQPTLRITAVSSDPEIPSAIFVYHADASAAAGVVGDLFECVASLSQLYDLLENPGEGRPFYRKNQLEFVCRSYPEAEELWEKIREDVRELVENIKASRNLQNEHSETIS
jgi:hypothetical protein